MTKISIRFSDLTIWSDLICSHETKRCSFHFIIYVSHVLQREIHIAHPQRLSKGFLFIPLVLPIFHLSILHSTQTRSLLA
ncbi:hypothetical protein EYC84_002753 [Monilinia fructicola]|uniref:Uncharacterized protein n=1 Tax=Monilinia fructicola TaxID=38448 RepID=A0A5M9JLW6_MONFR|nr:hypothetical protein EYC84_002753 [Monilinia fructicola]